MCCWCSCKSQWQRRPGSPVCTTVNQQERALRETESLEKSRTSRGQGAGIWSQGSSVLPGDWCKPCFTFLFWSDCVGSLGRCIRERSRTIFLFFFYMNYSWLPGLLLLLRNAQNNYTFRHGFLYLSSLLLYLRWSASRINLLTVIRIIGKDLGIVEWLLSFRGLFGFWETLWHCFLIGFFWDMHVVL